MVLLAIRDGWYHECESVFVHHGTDWPETYQYTTMLQWWLKANGHKAITILRPSYGGFSNLYDYAFDKSMAPSRRPRWCTNRFKIQCLMERYKKPAFQYIGFSTEEGHRAKPSVEVDVENRWPLLEAEMSRDDCKELIKSFDLPIPQKSGCFICPLQRKAQWVKLRREHPCLFQKALDLEHKNIAWAKENGRRPMYLSSSQKPLEAVVQENQTCILEELEYPPCQCGL